MFFYIYIKDNSGFVLKKDLNTCPHFKKNKKYAEISKYAIFLKIIFHVDLPPLIISQEEIIQYQY